MLSSRSSADSASVFSSCVDRRHDAAPLRRSFATVYVPHRNHIARESFGLGEVQIAPGAKKGDGGGASGWVEKAEVVLA